jgi:hypothetical protein
VADQDDAGEHHPLRFAEHGLVARHLGSE